jgi:hypothetical protein
MIPGWLYSFNLLHAARSLPDASVRTVGAVQSAEAAAHHKFPDGSLLILGESAIGASWPLHQTMAHHAAELAEKTDSVMRYHNDVPLFHAPAIGDYCISMEFWDMPMRRNEFVDSIVSFKLATDPSHLKIYLTLLRQLTASDLNYLCARVDRIANAVQQTPLAGEGTVRVISAAKPAGKKAVSLAVDVSNAGLMTVTWLGYQLYLARDVAPLEHVLAAECLPDALKRIDERMIE